MITVPEAIPVTIPDEPIVATEGIEEVHVPPGEGSERIVVEPTQTLVNPTIGAGAEETVTVTIALQPPSE